jgi:DNA-binding protein HU-beta
MAKRMSKSDLITEIASRTNGTKRQASEFLAVLTEVAYREAANGFTIPGICKLEVVDRRPRRCKDPQTGASLLIASRKSLRIRPVKKAKEMVTPKPDDLVTVLEEPEVAAAPAVASVTETKAVQFFSFKCPECSLEIEASTDLAGQGSVCPSCNSRITVPAGSATSAAVAAPPALDFIAFRCKACGQEIEASPDMGGVDSECPACGVPIRVPYRSEPLFHAGSAFGPAAFDAMKSRTIRIELPEEVGV